MELQSGITKWNYKMAEKHGGVSTHLNQPIKMYEHASKRDTKSYCPQNGQNSIELWSF